MKKMLYILIAIFIAGTTFAETVEFRVNMKIAAKKGTFAPGTDMMHLAGTLNGWNTAATLMTDADGDSIYTVSVDTLTAGTEVKFKFVKNIAGADVWETISDRSYIVAAGSNVFSAYYNNDSIFTTTKNVAITFSCNMEFEIVAGRFKPGTDTLSVRGSFNGWGSSDILSQSASDPNYYEKTVNYVTSLGEVINYKYAYINATGTAWEGDPNKTYTITQDDYDSGIAYAERTYNDLTLDNVTNYDATIKFVVNMNGAVGSVNGQPFPSIDNVYIAGANPPLQWPGGGWPNSDSATIHYLYNDGTHGDVTASDSLWSLNLVFPKYSPLRIQYKYGANWGLPSNGGANDNENGVGSDHFLALKSDMLSGTVRNQFGVMGDHELVDVIVADVRELPNSLPSVYSLAQNFPNPFNPVTNIRFAIPEAGLVTLKVYNLIGQEVATLLNDVKNAGTYNVDFNAANLSSGVYFYKINAGKYSSTMKMILMK